MFALHDRLGVLVRVWESHTYCLKPLMQSVHARSHQVAAALILPVCIRSTEVVACGVQLT